MAYTTEIEVRFSDMDAFNHVNNARYLSYIEHSRVKFFDEVMGKIDWESQGFIIARAEINFIRPVKLRDEILIEMHCSRIGNKSFDLSYKIFRLDGEEKTEMANALTVQAMYDYKNNVTIPVPEEWKAKFAPFMR